MVAPAPLLACRFWPAGEAVDARTLSFLLAQSLAEEEEEEEEEEERLLPRTSSRASRQLWRRLLFLCSVCRLLERLLLWCHEFGGVWVFLEPVFLPTVCGHFSPGLCGEGGYIYLDNV